MVDTLARFAAIRTHDGQQEDLSAWNPASRPHHAVTHNFIQAILGQAENHAPGEVGWRAVELLDAAYQSVQQNGRPILIEELYP